MGEILKRQYDLFVLKVGCDLSLSTMDVQFALEGCVGHELHGVSSWKHTAAELGIPERFDRTASRFQGQTFILPSGFAEHVKSGLEMRKEPGAPLWLQLVKPYGYLGLVPWEQLLQPALGVAMLRLPDFLVGVPKAPVGPLDVALCASSAQPQGAAALPPLIERVVDAVGRDVGPRPVRLNVFVDAAAYGPLRDSLPKLQRPQDLIVLHDPATASRYAIPERTTDVLEGAGRVENPWLLWMCDALQGRSVDVVHFICHGFLSGSSGAISFAESPLLNENPRRARFVGSRELIAFTTQTGAWSTVFTSPEGNYSEMGLRALADATGQLRPGPVVYHELRLDANLTSIAGVYGFLFGSPAPPPATPSLFLYCHPARVTQLGIEASRRIGSASPELNQVIESFADDTLVSEFTPDEDVPSWVSATRRFVEQRALQVKQSSGEAGDPNELVRREGAEQVRDVLRKIQGVVAQAARDKKSGGLL